MSTEIEIPGGTAVLRSSAAELSPRRRRPIEIVSTRLGRIVEPLAVAARILCEGDVIDDRSGQVHTEGDNAGEPVFIGPDIDLTEKQLELLARLNDAVAWALLQSWTLPQPLPASPDDMLDIEPVEVYDAIVRASARINAGIDSGFVISDAVMADGEPDTSLPTSA